MKSNKPSTLEESLKKLMSLIREINSLEKAIDDQWGVRLVCGYIPGIVNASGEINVRRGMEEIETALNEQSKRDTFFRETKILRHHGIEFRQYADEKTKVFVKAGCEPPKVQIVEDDSE